MGSIRAAAGWVTGWTAVGMAVLGYHPYAEDGGLYVAEIKHRIDPGLYPWGTEFVAGHLGFAGFTGAMAWAVKTLGMSLDWVLLGVYAVSLWGMLLGVWCIAGRCYGDRRAQIGAVGLVAVWLGVPVGGTSMYLADPYLTARSVAIALTVMGLAAGVWRRWAWAAVAVGMAVAVHPLMGGYGVVELGGLWCVLPRMDSGCPTSQKRDVGHPGLVAAFLLGALVVGWVGQASGAPESEEYVRVAITRYYWFLSAWQWFEWVGLVAPMMILGWFAWRSRIEGEKAIARWAVLVGGAAVLVALLYAREGARVHVVARLQPLRMMQMVYLTMAMVLGATVGRRVLRGVVWRWVVGLGVMAGVMFFVARETYPGSNALELPWVAPRNAWVRAFVWVREHTPRDAVFAIDANYVHWDGEDAQGFRAIAERSVLPDAAKDGGIASIRPELVGAWAAGEKAQAALTKKTDAERVAAVAGMGASWVVLGREGVTGFVCPYENERLRVCRLPVRSRPEPTSQKRDVGHPD
ncbi:hypothetical protein [Granulicella pectinivorans]|nr:hypothetical protein [Granulicella pectinivorans]